jgi:hypothetical protein
MSVSLPLTEIEIAARVYAHPLIAAYDKAIARLHKRHTEAYGAQFMDDMDTDADGFLISERGYDRWTEQEEAQFMGLYKAAQTMRQHVRSSLLK